MPMRNSCALKAGSRRRLSFPLRLPGPNIAAILLQQARFHVVSQVSFQDLLAHALAQQLILDGENHFHALVQIARHPVRAAHVNFLLAAVGKVKNAAVLEKAAHNAAHPNVVAHPTHPRTQCANAAHEQINLTPACEARYKAMMMFLSSSAFILAMMRAGRPWRACSASRAISASSFPPDSAAQPAADHSWDARRRRSGS